MYCMWLKNPRWAAAAKVQFNLFTPGIVASPAETKRWSAEETAAGRKRHHQRHFREWTSAKIRTY